VAQQRVRRRHVEDEVQQREAGIIPLIVFR
jgi:hypothetical protein